MGRRIAHEAGRRDAQLVLAGRRADQLVQLASTFRPGQARAAIVDLGQPEHLDALIAEVDVVINTVGPFNRLAAPVIAASLRARRPYVDLANELSAVRALLDRHEEARRQDVTLVTGAGFGVVATEALAIMLARASQQPLDTIRVAAAPAVGYASPGVQATYSDALAEGSPQYVANELVVRPVGEGATTLEFPDRPRRAIPAPVGDLLAARRATHAPNVVAYAPLPAEHASGNGELRSTAMAAGWTRDGRRLDTSLTFGEGLQASAAIAVEVAIRTVASPCAGTWTPCQVFGPELAAACGAVVRGPQAADSSGTPRG
jgi:saccharopine dehydrogenase (NAD+, L-lysine-forming)